MSTSCFFKTTPIHKKISKTYKIEGVSLSKEIKHKIKKILNPFEYHRDKS